MRALALVICSACTFNICLADDAKNQADSFTNAYAALCLKNLTNLEGLRTQLADMPKLPPEKASFFLQGKEGDAWPVPSKYGEYVLSLPGGNKICLLYARRVDAEKAEENFKRLLSKSPSPLTSKLVKDDQRETTANGPTHTISYEWSKTNANINMLFTLTTARSEQANLQGLASAALVRN